MRDYEELVKRLREDAREADTFKLMEDLFEAADAIEELSKPKWISVKERLPLYGQDVLATRVFGDGEKCQEILMAHVAVWNEETGEKWWNATNITHWMPLPEPPKEDKP